MSKITKNIANILTSINLFSGCVGIYLVLQNDFKSAFIAMVISAVADFFDGFAARLFKADGGIGKDLDSLADVVTFGVLPGFFMFQFIQNLGLSLGDWVELKWFALLIPIFSAWRLALFNNDTRQSTGFIGVPTPANALILASFVIWGVENNSIWSFPNFMGQTPFLLALIAITCYLLVSNFPLIAMKFKGFSLKKDYLKVFLVFWLIGLAIFLNFAAAIPALISYLIISIINHTYYEVQSRS